MLGIQYNDYIYCIILLSQNNKCLEINEGTQIKNNHIHTLANNVY